MANNELTYNDFLQRLNIQELLVDAGYQLNKRDGLRYPSYVKVDSHGPVSYTHLKWRGKCIPSIKRRRMTELQLLYIP